MSLPAHDRPSGSPSFALDFLAGIGDERLSNTRSGAATYTDITGTIQTAGVNVPRFEYAAPFRTNMLTNSGPLSDFQSGGWMSLQPGAAMAPDGTMTALKLSEANTNGISTEHNIFMNFPSVLGSTTYTASIYAKAGTRKILAIELRLAGAWVSGNSYCAADLTTGQIVSTSGGSAYSITAVGGGWYRISVTSTTIASPATPVVWCAFLQDPATVSYAGDPTFNGYFWGAQLEVGAAPTAFIPTGASQGTAGVLRGLLVEEGNNNWLLNSGAPATQTTASLALGIYTLWMDGTGSVSVAGTSAVITGGGTAIAGSPVTFTVTTAGTVTVTVTGSPTRFQLENQLSRSSYIATAGTAGIRQVDNLTMPLGSWFNPAAGTLLTEFILGAVNVSGINQDSFGIGVDTTSGIFFRQAAAAMFTQGFNASVNVGSGTAPGNVSALAIQKAALTYNTASLAVTLGLNGQAGSPQTFASFPSFSNLIISRPRGMALQTWHRRFTYWPFTMTAAQLQNLTQ